MRAITSLALPGVNGTITRIGLAGQPGLFLFVRGAFRA
jgi:hypothetical protein